MLKPGDTIDRYVIEALLGEGGMGAVYKAHDPRLDRTVAVKVVHVAKASDDASGADATARLLREARAAAKIDHPNAIAIYDVGEANGDAFIAMELVDGKTLRARLEEGSLSNADKLRVLTDVARALAAAHGKGIVHRDIKPENIMVRRDGGVKVLDFGIARRAAGEVDPNAPTASDALLTLTARGVAIGTPLYMTPEQIRGEPLDGRSDQFAWGVVAWEVFVGSVPWSKTSDAMALAGAILLEPVGALGKTAPDAPSGLEAVVTRALAKAASDRFASMDDVIAAMERCSSPVAAASAPAPTPASAPKPVRYSTEIGRAILSRALERQADAPATGYDADDILEAAREVGVDDETVRAAARDVMAARESPTDAPDRRRREIRRFIQHLVAYASVNTFLLVTMGWWLAKWVIFGWGIGIASHAARVIFPDNSKSRGERKRDRKRERKRDRKRHEEKPSAEVERGADELLTTAARRVRIAEPARAVRVTAGAREEVVEELPAEERGERSRRA